MSLRLRVTHYRSQPAQTEMSAVFSVEGGTLGRSIDSDLLLDDPSHYVALVQGRIVHRTQRYYWIQTGINPSAINNRPMESGSETLLQDGDYLIIGDYHIEVIIPSPTAQEPEMQDHFPEEPVTPLAPLLSINTTASNLPLEDVLPVSSDVDRRFPDALARSRILDDGSLHANKAWRSDPLGLNLFSDLLALSSPNLDTALGEHLIPTLRDTVRDDLFFAEPSLLRPTCQAIEPSILLAMSIIPDDYDPLKDLLRPQSLPTHERESPLSESPSATGNDSAVLNALLEGLGLPDLDTGHSPVELAYRVGEMLHKATAGAMDLLKMRSPEVGIQEGFSENQLNTFTDAESALISMLSGSRRSELDPSTIYKQALDALKTDETAAIFHMCAALKMVVRRLSPAAIAKCVGEPRWLDTLMPRRRKARMWDQLVAQYGNQDFEDQVQRLLGEVVSTTNKSKVIRLHHER